MADNEGLAAGDSLEGVESFSQLLFSSSNDNVLGLDTDGCFNYASSAISTANPQKMLCFGDYQINKKESNLSNFAQKSGLTCSDSSSASSTNNTNPLFCKSKKKRNGRVSEQVAAGAPVGGLGNGKKTKSEKLTATGHAKGKKQSIGERIAALQQLVSPFGKVPRGLLRRCLMERFEGEMWGDLEDGGYGVEVVGIECTRSVRQNVVLDDGLLDGGTGGTDTASVLHEAQGYIRFLQDQVQVLSSPYLQPLPRTTTNNLHHFYLVLSSLEVGGQGLDQGSRGKGLDREGEEGGEVKGETGKDLRSRGLCLVPVGSTLHVANSNGADFWLPAMKTNATEG
ncbi:hypothetical protein LguiA_008661 [Lonicera macranthoides]